MKVRDCPKCEGCPLRQKFPDNNLCPPRMGPSLRIVVAEAPGEEESIKLEPLVGGSGRIAQSMYRKAGVNWDELTLINTINCRPPDNVFPTDNKARSYCSEAEGEQIVKHCIKNHVLPVLESRPWTRLDIIGAKALYWLTGLTSIFKWRGSSLTVDTEDVRKRVS